MTIRGRILLAALPLVLLPAVARALPLGPPYVQTQGSPGAVTLAAGGRATPIVVSAEDWPGVVRAAGDLAADVERVSGVKPQLLHTVPVGAQPGPILPEFILVGTIGHSPLIDGLIAAHKLHPQQVAGQWEAELTEVVEQPMPGVTRALVIAGADKRGTIYGIYDLSAQMGVSPWTWWADVVTPHRDALYVAPVRHVLPSPAVRYRGIFLNDEAPALSGWTQEKFGGKNHLFYTHVFELLLRLHANYLWPAMWNNAFNEDDPVDPVLADEYGIVMGTSHHEPMLRAQQEWKRHGTGPWDYQTNAPELDRFWAEGIKRNRELESTITIGMRGDGDVAMSPTANTALLERIVADQRKIIAANADPKRPDPKIWALYKEVQEYYEKGMRVPDDVTLLWCDDNWGNLRRLPTATERARPGGAGIYYHFDYVGDPRSYKWLLTYNITKVWEQMHLAAQYGADRVWIVNVGDLKPMEFPIDFFLTMAVDPKAFPPPAPGNDPIAGFTRAWVAEQFGPEHADAIASLLDRYTRYNSRRKPEMLTPDTYSLATGEADQIDAEWRALTADAERVNMQLPENERPSFFELVLYPLKASATVGEMYIAAARNRLYAREGRPSANVWADETRRLFAQDAALSNEYNHTLLNGKWDHMMDQTHIGYTFWNEPPANAMPAVQYVQVPAGARLGVFAEGFATPPTELAPFDATNRQTRTLMLAPMDNEPVHYAAQASAPWILLGSMAGVIDRDTPLPVSIDWEHAPMGHAQGSVTITSPYAAPVEVLVRAYRPEQPVHGFAENDGVITIDAEHTSARHQADGIAWHTIPGFGETLSGIEALPVLAPPTSAGGPQACVDYDFTLNTAGKRTLQTILAPTLPFQPGRGLRYSLSVDSAAAVTVDAWPNYSTFTQDSDEWKKMVGDGVHRVSTPLGALSAGPHTLHLCRVDPGVVVERLILFGTKPPPDYLGPVESQRAQP